MHKGEIIYMTDIQSLEIVFIFLKPCFCEFKKVKGVRDKKFMNRSELITDRAGIPEGI